MLKLQEKTLIVTVLIFIYWAILSPQKLPLMSVPEEFMHIQLFETPPVSSYFWHFCKSQIQQNGNNEDHHHHNGYSNKTNIPRRERITR